MDEQKNNVMLKVATFIVDKRNLFFLLFGIAIAFSIVSMGWVKVENSLSAYLPSSSETRRGLDLMDEEYMTYGTAKLMIANIDYDKAMQIYDEIVDTQGVGMVAFDNSEEHYKNFSALYDVTFNYSEKDDMCLEILDTLEKRYEDYDLYVYTLLGDAASETIAKEMSVIIVYVAIIVLVVLILTSQTYAEVPVLILTFLASAALGMGTNYLLGTISFVSNSVAAVLQLALSIDYAVIFCNRYKEEHQQYEAREATIIALSKAIPEISASSLTTIGGLLAMTFMQFQIGPDLGIVLIKAIILSLAAVFLLMPGFIMLFAKAMDKTKHKNYVPKIPFVGKFAYASRYIIPPIFIVILLGSWYLSNNTPYVYGYSTLTTPIQSETQIAQSMIEDTFGVTNMIAMNVPAGDYKKEALLLADLESREEVKSTLGMANTEALDGYMLTDSLTPRQFAEVADLDYEIAELLYAAYAIDDENYGKIVSGISEYSVPLVDMFGFAYDQVMEGYVTLEDDVMDGLTEAKEQMDIAKNQLVGDNYSRMLVYLDLPLEGSETFHFLDEMHSIAKEYYGKEANIVIAGEATSQYDLKKTFDRDNTVVNVVSILVVLAVLLFTFKSAGMPVLLILVIQGCIFINFAFPAITHSNLFFMSYLIVSSIQMGANIDYAIVVSSRYLELKKEMSKKDAIIESMNFAFPTIITSGSMLAMAGILIGQLTSEAAIMGIGQCLGRGTIISIFVVMFVLPQILLFGDTIIEKTAFTMNMPLKTQQASGLIRIDGRVRGKIDGMVVGNVRGIVRGNISAFVEAGTMEEISEEEAKHMLHIENTIIDANVQMNDEKEDDVNEEM